jgi:hypothetical protein
MNRILLSLALPLSLSLSLAASAARAQDVDIQAGGMGLDMHIKVQTEAAPGPDAQPAPAPVAPPAFPTEMADSDFSALTAAIDAESFSQTRLGVLETALPDTWFTVAQVGALVDLFSFSADKVKVVELARGNMVDPKNGFKLLSHFTFSADKEAVKKLLK